MCCTNQVVTIITRLTWSVVQWSVFVRRSFGCFGEIWGKVMCSLFLCGSLSAGWREARDDWRCRRTNTTTLWRRNCQTTALHFIPSKNGLYNWLPFPHIHVHIRASYTNTSDPLTFPLVPPSGHGFYFSNICCFFLVWSNTCKTMSYIKHRRHHDTM